MRCRASSTRCAATSASTPTSTASSRSACGVGARWWRRKPGSPTVASPRASSPSTARVDLDDHAPDHLARLHRRERVVHLVQLDVARHHGAEVEAAVLDQADEAGEVPPYLRRPA